MRTHATLLVTLASLVAAAVPTAGAATTYPRVGLYGSVLGGGYPYTHADGSLDTLEIGRAARFAEVVLDVYPISPYRPDILQAMRARNPSIKLFAYLLAENIWNAQDPDSLNHIPTLINHTVRNLNGFLYDKLTGQQYPNSNINMAKKGANGHFIVAEAMGDIMRDHIIATGQWDGIFTDVFCHTVGWTQTGTQVIDYQRAGYASVADLDVAWAAACDTLASHMRRDGGPNFVLVGNCAMSSEHAYYNGWMRENFPNQGGGTWASNVVGNAIWHGYLPDDIDHRQPPHNWILSWANTSAGAEYQSYNTAKVRLGLASAALGEGVHAIGPGAKLVSEAPYQDWWYDEYAVDLATGQSSQALQNTGWLGPALGPASTYLWVSTAADAITNSNFETSVTNGWTFQQFAPASATLTLDPTTAGLGSASAHVHIATAGPVEWSVYLTSAGQMWVFPGSTYSATFRCKASSPRTLHVMAGNSGGQAFVNVDTNWHQYQAVLQPTAGLLAPLTFWFGMQAGDVWFDDVHFQTGVSSVWRRDFQNGIVLVNPTELTLNVGLEDSYRRILGVHETTVNNGAQSTSTTIGPYDALFLLRGQLDRTRPAAVQDLHPKP